MMNSIYRKHIVEHGRTPHHFHLLTAPDVDVEANNPLCGDRLRLTVKAEGGFIREIGWDGDGCMLCLASASILGEHVLGQSVATVETIDEAALLDLLGVSLRPSRRKCAMLALNAVHQAAGQISQ